MSAATRRTFLAGAAGLPAVAAVPAVVAGHPDAELLRLCASLPALRAAYEADDTEYEDCADSPAFGPYDDALYLIVAATPRTMDGLLARARVAKREATMPDGRELYGDSPAGQMAIATLHDLLRLHGGAA
jgi:predicted naringenin-chalcone synthase